MVSVNEAEKIILSQAKDFGTELVSFADSLGRLLAEDIRADRDFPPFNRVTMDGIAIRYNAYAKGLRSFRVRDTQSAGQSPIDIHEDDECIEIMTGAALSSTVDTIIPYEEIEVQNGAATVRAKNVVVNQNIHSRGKDKKQNDVLVSANQSITPAVISVAATVGKNKICVRKNPKIIVISTGDELVDIDQSPSAFQIRRSNDHTLLAILKQHSLVADLLHLPDDENIIFEKIKLAIQQYDVILLSGGVSMGKFDFVPSALEKLHVQKLFHKVQQRPGKPFWFGAYADGPLIFAFPGNPVSTFMCFHRYFLPWYKTCQRLEIRANFAILNEDFIFKPLLQYFLQVKLSIDEAGRWIAIPIEGNGSGDLANLPNTDAFMELPLDREQFKKGEVFRVWPFNQIW